MTKSRRDVKIEHLQKQISNISMILHEVITDVAFIKNLLEEKEKVIIDKDMHEFEDDRMEDKYKKELKNDDK